MKIQKGDLTISDFDWASQNGALFDYVISIGEPGSSNFVRGLHGQSFNAFHDCNVINALYVYPTRPLMENLRNGIERFLRDERLESVLVHCAAGVSRSTAAAIMLLVADGWEPDAAVGHVFEIRPIAHPNELMMTIMDDMFQMHGKLHEEVSRRKAEANQRLWSSHESRQCVHGIQIDDFCGACATAYGKT